ncbi:Predicted thiol-disulfide oxidoreductase YuxK, DCC family [Candidatus Aquiluna sp. UB-MaderosW2red]|nr:Predicted thiol-disulfide oxidoreductase YuxK, DCC family [Candidatus Aquiluna sp. UB-MaderosW2red]
MDMPILIFDGDCAFCSSSVRVLRRMIGSKRIHTQPYQRLEPALYGLSEKECSEALRFVSERGKFQGSEAVAQVLIESKTPWLIAGRILNLPIISSLANLTYKKIAANRDKLPGGTPECKI